MILTIDGLPRRFTPIKAFREAQHLPPEFGVALFEPKDYTGLGRIDGAGAELNIVRAAVLDAIPARLVLPNALAFVADLTRLFTDQLYAINPKVRLHDVEIEFAAAGFANVLQGLIYALVRQRSLLAHAQDSAPPSFEAVYGEWLDASARVSATIYPYQGWQVQIVTHAYGRAGLIVRMEAETHYLADSAIGCPAEGFMAALLAEAAAQLTAALRN
jgi:hypothetical protein